LDGGGDGQLLLQIRLDRILDWRHTHYFLGCGCVGFGGGHALLLHCVLLFELFAFYADFLLPFAPFDSFLRNVLF
jgi:hypothetical protein